MKRVLTVKKIEVHFVLMLQFTLIIIITVSICQEYDEFEFQDLYLL